jgi:hypothetical protein
VFSKKMPSNYSPAKDLLRFVQVIVVEMAGIFVGLTLLPYTLLSGFLLIIWIVAGSAASVFFIARALAVFVFRL